MITYAVDDQDIATARFGISPLSETSLSLRALVRPERYPYLRRWRRAMTPRLRGVDVEGLSALVAADESTPDYLNPRPDSAVGDFDGEMQELARLPAVEFVAGLEAIHGTVPDALAGTPQAVRTRVLDVMSQYWLARVQPWWPRMLATLRADVAHRAMVAAESGQMAMLQGLNDSIDYEGAEIRGWNPNGPDYETAVGGRGLVFVPTHFSTWVSYPFSPRFPPYVLYPARAGVATFDTGRRDTDDAATGSDALGRLIGRARAQVLTDLAAPVSSTDLAAQLGISVAGANQHLRSLRDAGLLQTTRHGRSVLYHRTTLGESLAIAPTVSSS